LIGVWIENGEISVRDDLPEPAVADGEAIVTVSAAGICGTDLALVKGYRNFRGVPGHEFVGVVTDGPADWAGARVVSEINVICAHLAPESAPCEACDRGRPALCARRQAIGIHGRDGAFAERVAVPIANLHRVPPGIGRDTATFVEPLAAAFRILEQVELTDAARVLVVGPGRLGQLIARLFATNGVSPDVVGRSVEGVSRAARIGLSIVTADALPRDHYDIVVECSGHGDGFGLALSSVRAGGAIVLKSTLGPATRTDLARVSVDEIRIIGSRCGPFEPAIEALANRVVVVDDLIHERFGLRDAPYAFRRAAEPGAGKILLVPGLPVHRGA
jgi:threonine dehydrogenase-like Zn-dependent dehydrogenase